ncbi:M56 family metallopeptidase [Tepidibacter mesophilus]|uniref:M56 family metallopeptidase n=1 Tax=Tepidibacter mesophilus TaxID=655607 RepID=UPI000C07BCF6|nr:M56 family metallopeptidase [Tepidibacter mesophilus]
MTALEIVFLWVLYSSLTSTVIILLVISIKKIFKNQISYKLHHALWVLVLVKLLFPFSLQSNLSLFNFLPENDIHVAAYNNLYNIETNVIKNVTKPKLVSIQNQTINENNFLEQKLIEEKKYNFLQKLTIKKVLKFSSYIWLFVFLLLSLLVIISALNFTKKIKTFDKINNPQTIQVFNTLKKHLKLKKDISLCYSNSIKSPFIFGFFKPKICISKDILNIIDHNELYYILLHELIHYKRKDLLYNLLEMISVILHWFNPIVWFAIKKMRFDRELACDYGVLEAIEQNESTQYGMTIIKLSSIISNNISKKILPIYFYENNTQIERRIIMIKSFKKDSYKISILSIIVFMLFGFATLTNAQINAPESQSTDFYLDTPYNKHFITLDRALDFIDFDFKVPDTVLKNYTFDSITLNKDEAKIKFFVRDVVDTSGFTLTVSKKELMLNAKKNRYQSYKDANNKTINKESIIEPMTISNINGTSITIKNTYEWTEKDIKELEKKNTEDIKHFPTKEYISKYFIWQDDGLWYSLDYYFKSTSYYGDTSIHELSMDDAKVILSSLKYTKDLKYTNYESESWKDHLSIYESKDLKHAEKIIGFTPKFPLQLPENFIPTSSRTRCLIYSETEPWVEIITTFQKESDSKLEIEFSQSKGNYRYEFLSENGYDRDTEIKANTITIADTKVFKFKENSNTETQEYYLWKKGDIFYNAKFIGKIDNIQEILKTLINEPPYFD